MRSYAFALGVPLLIVVRGLVRFRGAARTLRLLRVATGGLPASRPRDADVLDTLDRGVMQAAALLPGRIRCLEQSMTLFIVLRAWGFRAEMKIGVQTLPFVAHAWVNVEDIPVNCDAALAHTLTAFKTLT